MSAVRRSTRVVTAILVLTLLTMAIGAAPPAEAALPQTDSFYTAPASLPSGPPGTTIKAEQNTVFFDPINLISSAFRLALPPLLPIPVGFADSYRFMHTSRNAADQPLALTGTLIVPKTPWTGPGERPLLAYAVGGHGMDDTCTPSWQFMQGSQYELPLIAPYVAAGFAVVATDYQRYPTHTFAEPKSAGQAVLDSIRAATRLQAERGLPTGIDDSNPVVIAGYSEGGNASSAAAERQPSYAPEINLKGVATGGVPADLRTTAAKADGTLLSGVTFMAINALKTSYPALNVNDIPLNSLGRYAVNDVLDECMPEITQTYLYKSVRLFTASWRYPLGLSFEQALDKAPAWKAKIEELRIGRSLTPSAPVLVYHGNLDPWVPIESSRRMADEWCSRGANVTFQTYPLAEHFLTLAEAIPHNVDWLMDRAVGEPVASGC